jgi:hypothetical protein
MRWRPDQLDIWCADWARERRKMLGIVIELAPHERLGKLSCTLGRIKDDKVAAGEVSAQVNEHGHVEQDWPEVYTGISLDIHRGFLTMCGEWRQVMDAQYVWREIPPKEKAAVIGVTVTRYFDLLRMLKAYLSGYLRLENSTISTR